MKKYKIIYIAVMLMTAGVSYSCNNTESKDAATVIVPETAVAASISEFFSNALPATGASNCFFTAAGNDTCRIIDSAGELEEMCACQDALPEIDFTRYSLIIGKKGVPNSFYTVLEQKITEMPLSLMLTVKLHLGDHWPAFSNLYHWGLYPKLSRSKKLNVEYL